MAHSSWDQAERILCVRLDQLGDVLMTTPALRALKESRPGREITLLTSAVGAEIAPLVPEIDDVIVYDAPWVKATAPRADSGPEYAIADGLRRAGYDGAVIFTVYSQTPLPAAFLCFLADIPLRLAYCRENPYQLLTDWRSETEPEHGIRHEVRRQLDLVGTIGCRTDDERMRLRVPEEARQRIERLLIGLGIDGSQPWAVVHPGASAPSRRYPWASYAAAAGELTRAHDWRLVFTGGEAEVALVDEIRAAMGAPSYSLAGALDLVELAALLAEAPLLIANNTGPAHLAAAVGTPVVDLYALTNPQHTPWMVPSRVLFHDVPCKYCYKSICPKGHHHCLRLVPPAAVVRAALNLYAETAEPRSAQPAP